MTGLLNRIMDYLADRFATPLEGAYDEANYSTLSSSAGWVAPYTAIGIFIISPSTSAGAYAYLRDETDSSATVAVGYISSTGGMSITSAVPIVKGHKYRVFSASTNVATNGRCTLRAFKLLGGGS